MKVPAIFAALAASVIPFGPVSAADEPDNAPALVVVISIDQLSADLFAEYRSKFTRGLARLQQGVVFPNGYQSHAATETCPGHATILTGARPARSGIVANRWLDLSAQRDDKRVYCAEDNSVPGSSASNYTVSAKNLLVPTLGERLKRVSPASRVVAVAGKDRSAVMMGGGDADQSWWWSGDRFETFTGREVPTIVNQVNASLAGRIAQAQPRMELFPECTAVTREVTLGEGFTMGTGRFARGAGDTTAFRYSPEFDGAVFALSAALMYDMKLGQGGATDILAIGASATDYVGHGYGLGGSEMCHQLLALDASLGDFLDRIDAAGIDYMVVLTADHGGLDIPERASLEASNEAARLYDFDTGTMIAAATGEIGVPASSVQVAGNEVYIDPALNDEQRGKLMLLLGAAMARHPQVEHVYTRGEIEAEQLPSGDPAEWSELARIRVNDHAERSGDLYIVFKPQVTPIADPRPGYVSTHGSIWDYDRRVPILFWRSGMAGSEQAIGVETVDIAPTLAPLIGVDIPAGEIDGRCLDLDPGEATTCR